MLPDHEQGSNTGFNRLPEGSMEHRLQQEGHPPRGHYFKKGVIMKNSVRKLPLVAMLLALTVFAGKAAVQGLGLVSTTMWLYDPQRGEPTDPESYNPAPNANPDDCEGTAQVCLVSADEDANGNPDLAGVSGLIGAIESGSPHPNLAYGNFSGSN